MGVGSKLAWAALVVAIAACQSSSSSPRDDGGAPAPSSSSPPSPSPATIGPAGGSVISADGVVTVEVPPGAVSGPLALTIGPATDVPPPGALSAVYEIGPSGTRFAVPIAITFRYDPSLVGAPDDQLAVSTTIGGPWQTLPAIGVDAANHLAAGLTDHLSPYALTRVPKDQNPAAPCKCNASIFASCCQQSPGRVDTATPDWCWCSVPTLDSFGSLYDCYRQRSGDRLASGCGGDFADCCRNNPGTLWPYRSDICLCTASDLSNLKRCWRARVAQGEALGKGNEQIMCSPQDAGADADASNPPQIASVTVAPSAATADANQAVTFTATALDGSGQPVMPQPTFQWEFPSGQACAPGCTITPTGAQTAQASCAFAGCSCVVLSAYVVPGGVAHATLALTGTSCP